MRFAVWPWFSLVLLASCVKNGETGPDSGPAHAQNFTDVSYGADSKQKIDIYLPEGRTVEATKTMVLIHGGGWVEGDKADMGFGIDSFKTRLPGWAIININYRLASNNTNNLFPAQENDVKNALEFYLGRSAEYKVSKDLVITGASAGGHLALLHSFKNDPEKHVKAVVDFFGPADLSALWNAGLVQQLILYSATGKSVDQDPLLYNQSSPVNFITAQSPPAIILQGGADNLVPSSQATILDGKLTEEGVPHQLVFYPAEQHGWTGPALTDSFQQIQAFLLAHVQ